MTIPVFICTGFLDSGKTTLVKETLMEQEWIEDGKTLLILCEEGEEEYSDEFLREKNMVIEQVEEFEELTPDFFKDCVRKYRPAQVVIEYNGMWSLEKLLSIKYPRSFELQGVYSTVNGSTLDMYLKNMRNVIMEQLTESELIVVNRCPKELERAGFRRAVKVQNPSAEVIFEGMDGKIIPPSIDDLPYNVNEPVIRIDDIDFGVWYVDVYENPERYIDKQVEFKARVFRPRGMKMDMFMAGREIMTCCADDVRPYGFPCKMKAPKNLVIQGWYKVQARFTLEMMAPYGRPEAVLYLTAIEPAEAPEDTVVYLG